MLLSPRRGFAQRTRAAAQSSTTASIAAAFDGLRTILDTKQAELTRGVARLCDRKTEGLTAQRIEVRTGHRA